MFQVGGYQFSELTVASIQIIFFVSIFSMFNMKTDFKWEMLNKTITRGDVLIVSIAISLPLFLNHNRSKIEYEYRQFQSKLQN